MRMHKFTMTSIGVDHDLEKIKLLKLFATFIDLGSNFDKEHLRTGAIDAIRGIGYKIERSDSEGGTYEETIYYIDDSVKDLLINNQFVEYINTTKNQSEHDISQIGIILDGIKENNLMPFRGLKIGKSLSPDKLDTVICLINQFNLIYLDI